MQDVAVSRTPFIGRTEVLATLARHWGEGARWVSLVGPPGAGKTRIADEILQRSRDLLDVPAARVWACALSGVSRREEIVVKIADELRVPAEMRSGDVEMAIGDWLASGHGGLVVLDNVEQAAAHVAELVSLFRSKAPHVGWLLTSRVSMGHRDEVAIRVDPLDLPAEDTTSVDALMDSDAARLFVSFAAIEDTLDRDAVPLIVSIVRRLEGLPLSLDLAARRLDMMSLEALADRLHNRFEVVRDGGRIGAPAPYHDALWVTLDWSWEMLDPWQQDALGQLSVFQGRFTLPTAERVVVLQGDATPMSPTVLDALQALTQHSLLEARGEKGGTKVFFLLDTVRDFARLKWKPDASRKSSLWSNYCEAVGALGLDARKRTRTLDGERATQTLRWLRPDLRAVLLGVEGWPDAIASQQALACMAIGELLLRTGERDLHLELIESVLGVLTDGTADTEAYRGWLLFDKARVYRVTNRFPEGIECANQTLAIARALQDHWMEIRALQARADIYLSAGEDDLVRADDSAIRALPGTGPEYQSTLASMCSMVGIVELDTGNPEAAKALFDEGIRLSREAGDMVRMAGLLANKSNIYLDSAQYETAVPLIEKAREIFSDYGEYRRETTTIGLLGIVDFSVRPSLELIDTFTEVANRFQQLGDHRFEAAYRYYVALVALSEGHIDRCREVLDEILPTLVFLKSNQYRGQVLGVQAGLSAIAGDLDQAKSLCAAALEAVVDFPGSVFEQLPQAMEQLLRFVSGETDSRDGLDAMLDKIGAAGTRNALNMVVELIQAKDQVWRLAEDGSAFQPPDGASVSLGRRRAPKRLLAALLAHRLSVPGTGLTREELFATGWPDERIDSESAANRVYVALSTLRKLGLDGLLVQRAGAYLLDPVQPVQQL